MIVPSPCCQECRRHHRHGLHSCVSLRLSKLDCQVYCPPKQVALGFCSERLDELQERPVTKEVVTYVQERHPVAKQVS